MTILTGSQLLARARRLSGDDVSPYYISDTEMYIWITEAERELAAEAKILRDVVNYTLDASTRSRWMKLKTYPEIIEVRTVYLVDSNDNRYKLDTKGGMDGYDVAEDYNDYGLISSTAQLDPGRPKTLIFGKRTGYAEVSPPANADFTVEAHIVHYPRFPIENATDEPTIPERYHQFIPVGAALKAMEGSDDEQLKEKIAQLETVWARALGKAQKETGALHRDASTVKFNNEMW